MAGSTLRLIKGLDPTQLRTTGCTPSRSSPGTCTAPSSWPSTAPTRYRASGSCWTARGSSASGPRSATTTPRCCSARCSTRLRRPRSAGAASTSTARTRAWPISPADSRYVLAAMPVTSISLGGALRLAPGQPDERRAADLDYREVGQRMGVEGGRRLRRGGGLRRCVRGRALRPHRGRANGRGSPATSSPAGSRAPSRRSPDGRYGAADPRSLKGSGSRRRRLGAGRGAGRAAGPGAGP